MQNLPVVQEAKKLMNEAKGWSRFRWLFEKPRVRETADQANAALDRLNRAVKARWSDEVKATYKKLSRSDAAPDPAATQPESINAHLALLLANVIEADHAARRARESWKKLSKKRKDR